MPENRHIYLDNAATTRVAPEVMDLVSGCMRDDFGNPSSAHHAGIAAEKYIGRATSAMLAVLGDQAERGEVYWTSGGTESDALGVMGGARPRARTATNIVYSAIEHPAVTQAARLLEREGFRGVAVPVTSDGVVEVERFVDAVNEDTAVAALMLVNNEIGTLMPVAEIAAAIRDRYPRVHIHCDAVQALGKIPVDASALGADSVAFAGHKLHAPKGVGALWLRKGAKLSPLWAGGGQQEGVRSGTFNVPGIAGMGEAARLAASALPDSQAAWQQMADRLIAAAADTGVPWRHNGGDAPRAPHVLSLAFRGIPAEPLLHVLESRGVLVSAGSACADRSRKPSPVLTAIGVGKEWGTLRFSFAHDTALRDVDRAAEILRDAVRDF